MRPKSAERFLPSHFNGKRNAVLSASGVDFFRFDRRIRNNNNKRITVRSRAEYNETKRMKVDEIEIWELMNVLSKWEQLNFYMIETF